MQLTVSPKAAADLEAIADYIAADNADAAQRLIERIRSGWQQLLQQPYSGMARGDLAPGVRQLVIRGYLTLYRVADDRVVVLRVLHGRQLITGDRVTSE